MNSNQTKIIKIDSYDFSNTTNLNYNEDYLPDFKYFKPSYYSKYLLNEIIPKEEKRKSVKICSLVKNDTSLKNNLNISLLNDTKKEVVHRKLSKPKNIKDLNYEHLNKKLCDHNCNNNPYIYQFLTPINKFLSKDFKINFDQFKLKGIGNNKIKRNIPLNLPIVPKVKK